MKRKESEEKVEVSEAGAAKAAAPDIEEEALSASGETDEVTALKEELAAKEKEAKDNYDLYLRTRADMENVRKRLEKEKEDHTRYGNEAIIRELLDVIDNFERALEHTEDEGALESLKKGLKLVYEQTNSILRKHGLSPVESVGKKFDPNVHEAISHEESDGAKPGTVVQEFQKGYFLKDRLLRPAKVSVAKGGE